MGSRARSASLALCALAVSLATGCGHFASGDSALAQTHAELTRARRQVQGYAREFAAAIRKSQLSRSPIVLGSYISCPGSESGGSMVTYRETVTATPSARATMAQASHEISGILHAEGWRLVSIDFARVHLGLADTNHPVFKISQGGMEGAANILPYGGGGRAGAIVYMRSPCVNAGSLTLPHPSTGARKTVGGPGQRGHPS